MLQKDIHNFLDRYFAANDCELLERHEHLLHVQLTIELDKHLMNRPFYWHYQEMTGAEPNPMKLMLRTEQSEEGNNEGEFIHFGSPRLHQIFQSTQQLGAYIRLYEDVVQNNQSYVPLVPWLALNIKVSYQCDRKKDFLHSIGLNLINGMMISEFQSMLESKSLTRKIPDYCYTMSSLIKPVSGIKRIESYIEQTIHSDDPQWSIDARKRWQEDEALLDHFYQDAEVLPESYHVEKQALKDLYEPKVVMKIVNGGMFFLANDTGSHLQ
ncbi:YqhG family protein [Pseudalkalibacillus berkeleyi]|uniref:YqhG family protein n=1 Tax=Pseudalkalibacillus berkeleyi TaxID=1069813 RepID=A0ABS9H1Q3_9BACL|nr:YqhG family protein [Pseudalkalibacillus berkeleyi]MCF6137880.1 YqhG family protein [Pseudalkalibacillus berkeleyi]